MASSPVLGYWNYRGLGEPIRYLLHYLGVKYEETTYRFGPAPNYTDCPWYVTEKNKVGLDFPNLPYLIDGDLKITQSAVIMRYISNKYGGLYLPKPYTPESLKFDMAFGHVFDIIFFFHMDAYSPTFHENKSAISQKTRERLEMASKYLGDKKWFLGDDDRLSHVDFLLFEALDTLQLAFPKILDEFPNLVRYHSEFASLPAIAEYRKTSSKWPILAPRATFGGRGDPPVHA